MNQDDFLHDLYEEPRPEFVDSLWRELSRQDEQQEPKMELSRINGFSPIERNRRLALVATLIVLILGTVFVGVLALEMRSDDDGVHFVPLSSALTPTVSPELESTPTPVIAVITPESFTVVAESESIRLALLSSDGPLPETVYDVGRPQTPTRFSLTNKTPAVRLRLPYENIEFANPIVTLELAAYVPGGVAVRVSRYTGFEIQPMLIYKPDQLTSLPLEWPVGYVDDESKTDLIVELVTTLAADEEVFFRAYTGAVHPWPSVLSGVSCESYPQYCVPLVGGGEGDFETFEAVGIRSITTNAGVPGVRRGLTESGTPFIGDPDAPLHVAVFMDFICTHCNDYFMGDLQRFIKDYVLTGQVRLELILETRGRGPVSELSAEAALAAGEQGVFWEMVHELFLYGVSSTFSINDINMMAVQLGMDADALVETVESGRYQPLLELHSDRAEENEIVGVPSVMVQGGDGEWYIYERSYEALAQWVTRANAMFSPPGMTTVTLPLDPELVDQVAYGIKPDDYIDIWFNLDDLSPEIREEIGIVDPDMLLAFEDVLVVGIGSYSSDEGIPEIMMVMLEDDADLLTKLVDAGATFSVVLSSPPAVLLPGMVAVTVPLDPESILPVPQGDKQVTLIVQLANVTPEAREVLGISEEATETFTAFENVTLLNSGGFTADGNLRAITIGVSPGDAALITYLVDAGVTFMIKWSDDSVVLATGIEAVTVPVDLASVDLIALGVGEGDPVDATIRVTNVDAETREELGFSGSDTFYLSFENTLIIRIIDLPTDASGKDSQAVTMAVKQRDADILSQLRDAGAVFAVTEITVK